MALNPFPPLFLSFPLHQSEPWGAPRPDALALQGLLDKTVLSVYILFVSLNSLSHDTIDAGIRGTTL